MNIDLSWLNLVPRSKQYTNTDSSTTINYANNTKTKPNRILFCFFPNNRKIYVDNNQSEKINNEIVIEGSLNTNLNVTKDLDKIHYVFKDNLDPNYVREIIKFPVVMKLNSDEKMPEVARTVDKSLNIGKSFDYVDVQFFSGMFAYILFKNKNDEQYLAIKRLDNFQSNHSVLCMFAKNGKFGAELKEARVICGGEIFFNRGVIEYWNLKSGGYSLDNEFDENRNPNIQKSISNLWLANKGKFISIKEVEHDLPKKYTPKGSLRVSSESIKPYSAKTLETIFDSLSNNEQKNSQSTLCESPVQTLG